MSAEGNRSHTQSMRVRHTPCAHRPATPLLKDPPAHTHGNPSLCPPDAPPHRKEDTPEAGDRAPHPQGSTVCTSEALCPKPPRGLGGSGGRAMLVFLMCKRMPSTHAFPDNKNESGPSTKLRPADSAVWGQVPGALALGPGRSGNGAGGFSTKCSCSVISS